MKKRMYGALGATAAAALALVGCSGPATTETEGAAVGSLNPITVMYAPVHYEPAMIALEEGFFEEAGLDVTLKAGADPTAIIAQVLSGEVQIASPSASALTASINEGMPLTVVAGNGIVSTEFDTSGVLVSADSVIESVADLSGKTVGVIGLGNGAEVPLFQQAVEEGVADPVSEISLVAIPYTGMQAALESGTVDAVFPADPFYTQILSSGARQIAAPVREYQGDSVITVWTSQTAWADENKDIVEAFQEAMDKAFTYYADEANLEQVLQIRADQLQVPVEEVSKVLSPMRIAVGETALQGQLDGLHQFDYLPEMKVSELLWSGTPTTP